MKELEWEAHSWLKKELYERGWEEGIVTWDIGWFWDCLNHSECCSRNMSSVQTMRKEHGHTSNKQKWRGCLAFKNIYIEKWHPAAISWDDPPSLRRLVWFLFTHKTTSYFLRQNLGIFQACTFTNVTQDFCSDHWHPSPPFHMHLYK